MQNFFGFIDYNKNDCPIERNSTDTETYYLEYDKYNIFLSYTKHKESYSLNTKELLILFNGNISNKKFLQTQLNIHNEKISFIELIKEAYKRLGNKLFSKIEGNFNLIIFYFDNF